MRKELTEIEKFYIDGHTNASVDDLSKVIPEVTKKSIRQYVTEARANQTQKSYTKSGVTIMTEQLSQVGDANRDNFIAKKPRNCITTIKNG